MKYFTCSLDNISLGIPADLIERIIPVNRSQTTVYETENDEAFISIPALFRLKDSTAPHGLVLKSQNPFKTVLLSPKIDIELEIPEEDIRTLPKALAEIFFFCKTVCFKGQDLVLILAPEKIMERER